MPEIGTVISTLEGPTTNQFSFVINHDKDKLPIKKGQFVQLQTEEGLLIARVSEIAKTNRYFMRAESVREFERSGRTMMDIFPVDRWEYLVANSIPLGIFSDGKQYRTSFPPSPGEKVFPVDEKILTDFLGLDINGVHLGELAVHDVDVKLNLTRLFQKHVAILAISGAGKSHLASVMIEELLERQNSPAVIVFDPHGEYVGFAQDPQFINKTKIFNEKNISISINSLSAFQIAELIPDLSPVQKRELSKVIQKLREKKESYNFDEFIQAIEESDIQPQSKGPMIGWLSEANTSKIFKNISSPSIEELAKPGQLVIFDLSEFTHLRDKQIIVTAFTRKLFEARKGNRICPFVLFVEEAHQFAPEGIERSSAISKSVIETIAREGRKFNACLVLISQRPINLSTTALSQCNTHFILRVTNPYDLDHIGRSSEGVTRDVLDMIAGLKVGEAFVVGEAVNYPLLIRIKNRKSKKTEKGIRLEEALTQFNDRILKNSEDLKAFI